MVALLALAGCRQPVESGNAEKARRPPGSAAELDRATGSATAEEKAARRALLAGRPQEAAALLPPAIALRQAAGEIRWEVADRNLAGLAQRQLQNPAGARREFLRAERLAAADGFLSGQAAALNNLALLEQDAGDFGQARVLFRRALRRLQPLGAAEPAGEAALYRENLARLLMIEGDLDEAERLLRPPPGVEPSAAGLAERAWLLLMQERPQEALEALEEALDRAPDPFTATVIEDRRGTAFEQLGRIREARSAHRRALELAWEKAPVSTTAAILTNLCRLQALHPREPREEAAPGGNDPFTEPCDAAVDAAGRPGVPPASLASAHYWQARNGRRLGRLREAQEAAREAARRVALLRSASSSPERRSRFLEDRAAYFSLAIELTMERHRRRPELGFDRVALADTELWRARGLAEEAGHLRGGEPLYLELQPLRRSLRDRESARRQGPGDRGAGVLDREIEELEARVARLETELRGKSPRSGELAPEMGFELADLQRRLDGETTVFDLVLGVERSYLWRIGAQELASFELPAATVVEGWARRYLELIASPRLMARRASALEAGVALAETLFGTGLERLEGSGRRLVFVGDGDLAAFPIAALPMPSSTPDEPTFLVERKEIVALPSLRMLAVLRRPRPAERRPTANLALIGDPWYDMRRWAGRLRLDEVPPAEVRDRTGREAPFPVGRLPFAGLEMDRIAAHLGGPRGGTARAQGPDASRALALSDRLEPYAVLHFSAHGELAERHPDRASIVLSELDREGRARDGRLTPEDLGGLDWRAELVVASSCEGAGGRPRRFEGLGGLPRGFFYAGASRTLASLWQVEGKATAELMEHFYTALVDRRLAPGEALRWAQNALLAEARAGRSPWRAPYYWSGFVLIGDWRTFSLS